MRAKLIDLLKDGKPLDVKADTELTEIAGADTRPGGKGYGALMKAINYVRKHHGVVWKRVRDADAVRCLDAKGIIESSDARAHHVRRESTKAVQELRSVALDNLEESDRPAFLSRLAQHGTLAQFARGQTQKKLETAKAQGTVSPAKLLEALKR